jgi:hypothetical protein
LTSITIFILKNGKSFEIILERLEQIEIAQYKKPQCSTTEMIKSYYQD